MSDEAPQRGPVETVLLDAGGVLLDLDYRYLRRLIATRRQTSTSDAVPSASELARFEALARREIHEQLAAGRRTSDAWRDYFHIILARSGVPGPEQPAIIDSLWEAHQRIGLWTVAVDGGLEAVAALKRQGLRLGVVSNAEGRVALDLDAAGYAGEFETVVDSHLVGVEKPDPAIFHIALERMGARAERTVFVGDLPAVDLAGARAAGLTPILLDRHDLYPEVEARRLASIRDLPSLLAQTP